jgi:hypothetical protein
MNSTVENKALLISLVQQEVCSFLDPFSILYGGLYLEGIIGKDQMEEWNQNSQKAKLEILKQQNHSEVISQLGKLDGNPFIACIDTMQGVEARIVSGSIIQLKGVDIERQLELEQALNATSSTSLNVKRAYTLVPITDNEYSHQVEVNWHETGENA